MTDNADVFDYTFEILNTTRLYDGFLPVVGYRLRHRLFAGGWSAELTRECLEQRDAVAVLPYDPQLDRLVLVEQFRVGALNRPVSSMPMPWLVEIVAGLLEAGESAADVARRETREETGRALLDLEPICEFLPSPGGSSERVMLYCGRIDSHGAGGLHGIAEEHEDIRAHVIGREQAWAWYEQGKINTAPAIIALQWLQLNYRRLRKHWA